MIKKILMATTITILLAAIALPVLAKPPQHFSGFYEEAPWTIADCGDFTVETKDTTIYLDGTVHYDKDGNMIKGITHWRGDGVYWSPETGKEVHMDSNLINTIDYYETGETIPSETIATGIQFKITVPGAGTILMDVGRMVFQPFPDVIWEAGQHPVLLPDDGGWEKLCNYFAD
jgi:hypothetical protein